MTKKKHEELVEEIAYFLSKHRFVSHDVRVVEADRDYAREIIRSILSAVRDGRLDEELGVSKEEIEKELAFALGKEEEALETTDIPRYCEHCGSEEHYTSEHY